MRHQAAVLLCYGAGARDMGLRDHQDMHRRFGLDIVKRQHLIVLIYRSAGDFPGYNFAENTVHTGPSSL